MRENFNKLNSLSYADLRDNADYCGICGVMSDEESQNHYNSCERDKFEMEVKIKEIFANCISIKIDEKDEIKEKLSECFEVKEKTFNLTAENFQNCVSRLKPTIENLNKFECLKTKISVENQARENFEGCISTRATPVITQSLQECYKIRNERSRRVVKFYTNCTFCKIVEASGIVAKCGVRYVRDFGDDKVKFQADVERFFSN